MEKNGVQKQDVAIISREFKFNINEVDEDYEGIQYVSLNFTHLFYTSLNTTQYCRISGRNHLP